ncbi:MAG: SPFH domain-containing protein, partial [Fusobacteriaceae bacterium]
MKNNFGFEFSGNVKKYSIIIGTLMILIIFMKSCYTVKTGEVALVFRFGKLITSQSAGLNFKNPLIDSVKKISVKNVKFLT